MSAAFTTVSALCFVRRIVHISGPDIQHIHSASLQSCLLRLPENIILHFSGIPDMLQNQLGMRRISRKTSNRPKTEKLFGHTGAMHYILHFVHVAVIFHRLKKTFIHGNHIFFHCILCKSKGQSQKQPSLSFHIFHSSYPSFLHYSR